MSTRGNGHRTETPDVSHIRNVEVMHEMSDINVRAVATFVVVLTVSCAIISLGLWFLFQYFNTQKYKERAPGPLAIRNLKEEERLPPGPRLQGQRGFGVTLKNGEWKPLELRHPQAEYEVLRDQWELALQTGVKDSSGNTVGMPIQDAMKQVVSGQGLPSRATQGKVEDFGLTVPTDTSSGRAWMQLR
jgi:hypothetical protein